ncbi:hypothetical protein PBN151_4381 [Paenibacillus sp. NAIST15-1]|nr:hypothetical protein PBN151_4381 [Paenibacillus sp. NAIST15-1]
MRAMVIDKYGKIPMRMAEVPMPEINEYEIDSDYAKKNRRRSIICGGSSFEFIPLLLLLALLLFQPFRCAFILVLARTLVL